MIITGLTTRYNYQFQFVPYNAFVWFCSVSQNNYTQPSNYDSDDFAFTSINQRRVIITSVRINISGEDLKYYISKESLTDCINDDESFYFDVSNQLLYVHFNHLIKPDSQMLRITEQKNYTGATERGVWYDDNDIEYLPKLKNYPEAQDEADPLVYGKMAFLDLSFEYDNTIDDTDTEFDSYIESPIPGSELFVSYISEDELDAESLEEFICDPFSDIDNICDFEGTSASYMSVDFGYNVYDLYTGIIDKDFLNKDTYTINTIDKRSKESTKIPFTRFTLEDYPQLKETDINKIIPEGYGDVKGAVCYCLTAESGSGNQTFKFATDGTSIIRVYVKNDDVWEEVSTVSTDAANGEFVLSASVCLTSGGSPKKVKADVTLRNIKNPADIISDINDRYLSIEYDASNYDTSQWTSEKAYLENVGILIEKQTEIFDIIEKLQAGSNYGFKYNIKGDGKRSIKVDYPTRDAVLTLDNIDILNNPTANRDFTQYASIVNVNYANDYADKEMLTVENTDYYYYTTQEYNYKRTYEIDSLLQTQEHAEKASIIAEAYHDVLPIWDIETENINCLSLEVYDFINVNFSEDDRALWGLQKCKVLAVAFNPESEIITLKVQGGYELRNVWITNSYDFSEIHAGTSRMTLTEVLNEGVIAHVDNILSTTGINHKIGDGTTQWQNLPYKLPVYIEISADTDLSSYDFAVNGNRLEIYNTDTSNHTLTLDGSISQSVLAGNMVHATYIGEWVITYTGGNYPIGSQYIQVASAASNTIGTACPTSESPASLYGGTWTELWNTESIFLRTQGTLADTDRTDGKQADALQECTGIIGSFSNELHLYSPVNITNMPTLNGVFGYTDSNYTGTNRITSSANAGTKSNTRGLTFALSGSTSPNIAKTDDDETRTVNRLMIIWQRTA